MKTRLGAALLALLLAAGGSGQAFADPYDYVLIPYSEKGKFSLRYSAGVQDERDESASGHAVALGYSPTDWWYTEFWASQEREGDGSLAYDGWYWSNQLHLFSGGRNDVSFYVSYWKPRPGTEGWNWTIGPMWQYSAQRFDFNLNLLVSRWVHPSFPQPPARLSYQAQVKTLLARGWEWGGQMYGDFGALANPAPWRRQTHQIGPALFGHRATDSAGVWSYDAALLFGLNDASPRSWLRAEVAYQF